VVVPPVEVPPVEVVAPVEVVVPPVEVVPPAVVVALEPPTSPPPIPPRSYLAQRASCIAAAIRDAVRILALRSFMGNLRAVLRVVRSGAGKANIR